MHEVNETWWEVWFFHASRPSTKKQFTTYEEAEAFHDSLVGDSWCSSSDVIEMTKRKSYNTPYVSPSERARLTLTETYSNENVDTDNSIFNRFSGGNR